MTAELIEIRNRTLEKLSGRAADDSLGRVCEVRGNSIRATLPQARVGDVCILKPPSAKQRMGEIVAVENGEAVISCYSDLRGVCNLTQVLPTHRPLQIGVGEHLLGRVIDPFGNPLDGSKFDVTQTAAAVPTPVIAPPPNPMQRQIVSEPFTTGIRVIDTLLATGKGQRVGVFGGAGMGKSSLTSMLINFSEYDAAVIGLIGERGREIRELWDRHLDPEQRKNCVVVASTSDRPAVERRLAGLTATAIAEALSDSGKNVLLVVDSVTRIARAQREIGLSAGEPPSRRGFPPSVASFLAEFVERAGPRPVGSITAFFTVLVEGALEEDPIAEEVKSLLDGHVILSSKLAEKGHYPAIDVLSSRSRLQADIAGEQHNICANHIRALLAKHRDVELLLQIGEYSKGSDFVADEAIAKLSAIEGLLKQSAKERVTPAQSIDELIKLAYAQI